MQPHSHHDHVEIVLICLLVGVTGLMFALIVGPMLG